VSPGARQGGRSYRGAREATTIEARTVEKATLGPHLYLVAASGVTLALDIVTKTWARHHLDGLFGAKDVCPGILTLILKKNRVDSWGILESVSDGLNRTILIFVAFAAIVFVVAGRGSLQATPRGFPWGRSLVLGGALGNVLDRIRFGYVVDFIDFHIMWGGKTLHAATVNVADIAIGIGVGLLAISRFKRARA
jgi:signal peptidase II